MSVSSPQTPAPLGGAIRRAGWARAAGTILHRLDVPEGDDLVEAVGTGAEESNVEVVIRMLNRRLNAAVGRDDDTEGRNAWPLAALKAAKDHVADVRDTVLADIEAATTYSADDASAPSASGPDEADGDADDWDDLTDFDWGDPF